MSRIGKQPVNIPDKVTVSVKDNVVVVKGPKGELSKPFPKEIGVVADAKVVNVTDLTEVKDAAGKVVRDEQGRELLRLNTFEPVSENPVFSFDFPGRVAGGLRLVGTDNNGNRIASQLK